MERQETNSGVLATAVYITGNTAMESGRRYLIAIDGERFHVRGPLEIDPNVIVLDRPLAGISAVAFEQRILVSEPGDKSGVALAFMSVDGRTPDNLAEAIVKAARGGEQP
jgi:hypothetical protein